MNISADKLYDMLYRSPSNERASGVALVRSGRYVVAHSALDLEKLASQLNEHFKAK